MNNEEDVKHAEGADRGEAILPNIKVKRNQFFDLDEFNSEEKEIHEPELEPHGKDDLDVNITPGSK